MNTETLWMMFTIILMITMQKKRKILIVFDDMIAHIKTNKRFQVIIKELLIRCRKLKISLAFIISSTYNISQSLILVFQKKSD